MDYSKKEELALLVLEQIRIDVGERDYTAIVELLGLLPEKHLQAFLRDDGEVQVADETKNEVLDKPESKNYLVTLGRTYDAYKEITHTVLAYSEDDAIKKAFDKEYYGEYKFDDAELKLDLSQDDEVVMVLEEIKE